MKIFLLGMMGAGKSYWAKKLAKKLKCGCYDLDFLVESHEEKTITELFADEGEEYFRKTEAKVLRWFAEKKTFVLATGGGTPFYHDNMEWMNKHGITIWIDEPVETIFSRLQTEKQHRPAISQLDDEALMQFIRDKLAERSPYYSQSRYHLQEDNITETAFSKILKENA